jgi:hypothetical protein
MALRLLCLENTLFGGHADALVSPTKKIESFVSHRGVWVVQEVQLLLLLLPLLLLLQTMSFKKEIWPLSLSETIAPAKDKDGCQKKVQEPEWK